MGVYPAYFRSLGEILEEKAAVCGDKVFLQYEEEQRVTYREVNHIANRIANGLMNLGVKTGDKVALFLPNSLELLYLWFGISKAGAIDVPINLANKGTFLSHQITDSESKVLIIGSDVFDRLALIEGDLPKLEKVVIWSKTGTATELPNLKFDSIDYYDLISSSPETPEVKVKPTDLQTIIYTSGTTGSAKGVMDPHTKIAHSALEYIEAVKATPADVFFTCLPLFHANARILCVYPAMLLGTKVVIYEKFSASRFWDQIRKAGATIFNSLGAMAHFIYNQPRREDDADNPVRVCAAFPMPASIFEDFQKRYNLKVTEGYGLTEVAIITYDPYDQPKKGSCGKETGSFEVRIVDENDFPVPTGSVGEIVARGRSPWITSLGYWNNPEKSVELMRNYFYHTGDGGYLDEDGYLFFVDRMKDYIRRRGENISSFEIERVVNAHPCVVESAAISVKSELSEDEVKIVVVLEKGKELSPEELLAFCSERMPYFAVPRYIEFLDGLPKTPNEKVQKSKLREARITANTWDREKAGIVIKK
ncbi:MAG: ATP-dependent acyl-CoA ligase [Thermodesulfobacteriota bacterium]